MNDKVLNIILRICQDLIILCALLLVVSGIFFLAGCSGNSSSSGAKYEPPSVAEKVGSKRINYGRVTVVEVLVHGRNIPCVLYNDKGSAIQCFENWNE